MATKKDREDDINSILGTDMEFSKMKSDDLDLLYELLDEGALLEPQAKHIAKEKGKDKLDEQIDNWKPGQIVTKLL